METQIVSKQTAIATEIERLQDIVAILKKLSDRFHLLAISCVPGFNSFPIAVPKEKEQCQLHPEGTYAHRIATVRDDIINQISDLEDEIDKVISYI